jgi:hypothetical protein
MLRSFHAELMQIKWVTLEAEKERARIDTNKNKKAD